LYKQLPLVPRIVRALELHPPYVTAETAVSEVAFDCTKEKSDEINKIIPVSPLILYN